MSDAGSDGHGNSGDDTETDAALSERRRRLEDRLEDRAGSGKASEAAGGSGPSPIAQAFRLSSELVAGVAVGFGIGWGVDWLLGSSPWGMIVFLLLGFAAGVLNMLRATGQGPRW